MVIATAMGPAQILPVSVPWGKDTKRCAKSPGFPYEHDPEIVVFPIFLVGFREGKSSIEIAASVLKALRNSSTSGAKTARSCSWIPPGSTNRMVI